MTFVLDRKREERGRGGEGELWVRNNRTQSEKADITQAQEALIDVSVGTKRLVGNILDNICKVSE